MFIVKVCLYGQKCGYTTGRRKRRKLLYAGVDATRFERAINVFVADELHRYTLEHEFCVPTCGSNRISVTQRERNRLAATTRASDSIASSIDGRSSCGSNSFRAFRFSDRNSDVTVASTAASMSSKHSSIISDRSSSSSNSSGSISNIRRGVGGGVGSDNNNDGSTIVTWLELTTFLRQFVGFPIKRYERVDLPPPLSSSSTLSSSNTVVNDEISMLAKHYEFVRVMLLDDEEMNLLLTALYRLNNNYRATNSGDDRDEQQHDSSDLYENTCSVVSSVGLAGVLTKKSEESWQPLNGDHCDHGDQHSYVNPEHNDDSHLYDNDDNDAAGQQHSYANPEELRRRELEAVEDDVHKDPEMSVYAKCRAKIDELNAVRHEFRAPAH